MFIHWLTLNIYPIYFRIIRKPSSSTSYSSSAGARSQVLDSYEYFRREKSPAPKHDNSALHESIKQVMDDDKEIIKKINLIWSR